MRGQKRKQLEMRRAKNRNQLYRKRMIEETAWDEKGKREGTAREEEEG